MCMFEFCSVMLLLRNFSICHHFCTLRLTLLFLLLRLLS